MSSNAFAVKHKLTESLFAVPLLFFRSFFGWKNLSGIPWENEKRDLNENVEVKQHRIVKLTERSKRKFSQDLHRTITTLQLGASSVQWI